jgi:hypothetical protein
MAFCPSCGAPVTPSAQLCGRCGASLKAKAATGGSGSKFKGTMLMSAVQARPAKPMGSAPPPAGSVPPPAGSAGSGMRTLAPGGSVPPPAGPSSRPPAVAMPATAPGQRFKGTIMMGAIKPPDAGAPASSLPAAAATSAPSAQPAAFAATMLGQTQPQPSAAPMGAGFGTVAPEVGGAPYDPHGPTVPAPALDPSGWPETEGADAAGPALRAPYDDAFPGDRSRATSSGSRLLVYGAIGLALVVALAFGVIAVLRG